jgi:hypothetical protein
VQPKLRAAVQVMRAGGCDLAVLAAALAVVGLAQGCAESRRSLGDECLKSQDCLSGICSQFACAASPPTLDTEENADAASPEAGPSPDAALLPDTVPDTGEAVEASGGDD